MSSQDSNFNFSNKVILVTGGAQGIGLAISRSFLQAGATVEIWDYSTTAIDQAQTELKKYCNQCCYTKIDITNRESIATTVQNLKRPVDILINNAGITRDKSFNKMQDSDWDAVINTNLTGLYNVTHALLTKFNTNSKQNRIINISSVVALYGNFGQSNYAAAKAGVIGLSKTWAKELGRKGFTVNAIAPGFIQTPMTQAMPSDVLAQMSSKVSVQRLGETQDIANSVLFLASESASYINGAVLSVDGGLNL